MELDMLEKIGDYLEICDLNARTVIAADTERGVDKAVITGILQVNTPVKVLYMASLELDGMEMHESFRLVAEPGENEVELPEIKVINPIRREDGNCNYALTLKIYASGGKVYEFSTAVRF